MNKSKPIILGIVASFFMASVVVGAIVLFADKNGEFSSVIIFSNFIVVPLLMGILNAYFWRNLTLKNLNYVGYSAIVTLAAIIGSAIFLKEGVICLLIVSPLIFGFTVAGAFIGKYMFRKKNNTLNVSLFGLIVLIFAADVFSPHENSKKVSDTLVINAPIEKVWPLVIEYEPIQMEEKYWLFKAGMPSPVQSTVDGHFAGAGRKCIFSNGYVFDEKMVVYKPNEELTFDIVSQPLDPEIMGHIKIQRGQFILIDNGDSTTTLIGNSWYKLYVFPAWYFDLWSESITRNVHLRVMEHIKMLSEKGV